MVADELAPALLAQIPTDLYHALPAPRLSANACSSAVALALRSRNARAIADWLAYEQTCTPSAHLAQLLECSLAQYASHAGAARLADEARDLIASRSEGAMRSTDAREATITGMLAALRSFDERWYRHSLDVAAVAGRVAGRLGCDTSAVRATVDAARVHDLGRLRVVSSQDALSDVQRAQVREQLGDVSAFRDLPGFAEIAEIVQTYYLEPGWDTDVEVAILRAVDSFQSMLEWRPYRSAIPPVDALMILEAGRDVVYDGHVLDALRSVLGSTHSVGRTA